MGSRVTSHAVNVIQFSNHIILWGPTLSPSLYIDMNTYVVFKVVVKSCTENIIKSSCIREFCIDVICFIVQKSLARSGSATVEVVELWTVSLYKYVYSGLHIRNNILLIFQVMVILLCP